MSCGYTTQTREAANAGELKEAAPLKWLRSVTPPGNRPEMCITTSTVKSHLNHILGKLGVNNRTQATIRARNLGLAQ